MSDVPEYEDDRVLAGEYALGLLSPGEAAEFEARLAGEPDLRLLYIQWTEDFAATAGEIDPVAPPAHLQGRIEARLFGGPPRRGLLERFGLTGLAAALIALVLFFSFDDALFGPGAPTDPVYVADITAEDASLVIEATYDADGSLYLQRLAGAAREGRALELWLIEGSNPPVSLGVLPAEDRARLIVSEDLRARLAGAVLAVSDEPPGGSPTGLPTGDVLALGEVTNL